MTASAEHTALQTDAENRVAELKAVARRLYLSRDDSMVLSELLGVLAELRQAEAELQRVDGMQR